MVYRVPKFVKPEGVCTGCFLSKQSRKPFPKPTTFHVKQALEMLYNQDEAFGPFKKFTVLVEKKSKKEIKVLRTDRGGEFCSKQFLSYCKENGIGRHYMTPYIPQQNVVVERRNRMVVALAWSLLMEKNMPSNLWGEEVRNSIYGLHRFPTRALSRVTPHEAWTGTKPDLSHLRMFGCIAHMEISSVQTKKLDDKKYDGVLGRRVWNKSLSLIQPRFTKVTKLPSGKKPIRLKLVDKLKRDSNGEVVKHKARLVAKGYVQKKGIDFEEVFAPVTRLETVRLLLAVAAKNGWEVHHMDVKSTFLNGDLEETVYVTRTKGFVVEGKAHMVCKLIKVLYGLKQAPRAWYSKLRKCLEQLGFEKCPYEHAVYTRREGDEVLIITVRPDKGYVNSQVRENAGSSGYSRYPAENSDYGGVLKVLCPHKLG
ncbi:hypothetical protein AgCh_022817 [Apium graveolens]